MFRYADETYRQTPPAKVDFNGFTRNFNDLTRKEWDEIGFNEAVPLKRELFTTYETEWVKEDDLIYREQTVSVVVDEEALLAALKEIKQAEITSHADNIMLAEGIQYGAMERQTWEQQYNEAKAYQADAGAEVPLLKAIALNRGMDVARQAERIVTNKAAWILLSGTIVGQRLAYQDALDAATTAEEVEAIEVNYVLPE